MSAPTHVFIGVRGGEVFGICATTETIAHWFDHEGADFVQRVPLSTGRSLLFQKWAVSAAAAIALSPEGRP